jgi:predicted outer membrane repeat protein
VVLNSVFTDNAAIGRGANPAKAGTPGGGSGGAIYADGNRFTIRITDSLFERNTAAEGGGAIFFVSNDRTGTLSIQGSTMRANPSAGFETKGLPGIFFLGAGTPSVGSWSRG